MSQRIIAGDFYYQFGFNVGKKLGQKIDLIFHLVDDMKTGKKYDILDISCNFSHRDTCINVYISTLPYPYSILFFLSVYFMLSAWLILISVPRRVYSAG